MRADLVHERQGHTRLEQPRGTLAADDPMVAIDRLQVHRFPDGTALDAALRERCDELIAPASGDTRFEREAGQPPGRHRPPGGLLDIRLGHEGHARCAGERSAVGGPDRTSASDAARELCDLRASEGREQVRQAVVEPDVLVFVVQDRLARLGGQVTDPCGESRIIGDEGPPARRRHDLVAVERQRCRDALRSGGPTSVGGTERLRRIDEDRNAVAVGDRCQSIVVRAAPVEVDRHDRRWRSLTVTDTSLELLLDQIDIDGPRVVAVDEHGRGTGVHDGVGRRHERERRHEHVVTGTDPEGGQPEVQRGRAAGEADGMRPSGRCGEFLLEGGEVRAGRRDPSAVEGGEQRVTF